MHLTLRLSELLINLYNRSYHIHEKGSHTTLFNAVNIPWKRSKKSSLRIWLRKLDSFAGNVYAITLFRYLWKYLVFHSLWVFFLLSEHPQQWNSVGYFFARSSDLNNYLIPIALFSCFKTFSCILLLSFQKANWKYWNNAHTTFYDSVFNVCRNYSLYLLISFMH